jgi:hypothetical protein
VDQVEGNWWELHVVGVKDPKITGDILNNVYLFFDARSGTGSP